LPDNVVGSKADLVGDGVLVGIEVLVKVGLEVGAQLGPVDGLSSNGEGGSEVNGDCVKGDGVEDQPGDGDLVSDDVDEKGSISLNLDLLAGDDTTARAGKVAGWDGLLTDGASVQVAGGLVGGSVGVDFFKGQLENGSEEKGIDVNVVVKGRKSSGGEVSTGASFVNLGKWVKSDVELVRSGGAEWIIDGTSWSFSIDGFLRHCASGEGACDEESGNEENLHYEIVVKFWNRKKRKL